MSDPSLNGQFSKHSPPGDQLLTHMYHTGATMGRIEQRLDHIDQRVAKLETRRRINLVEYLPAIYGIVILGAVVIGKLTVLQGVSLIKGG